MCRVGASIAPPMGWEVTKMEHVADGDGLTVLGVGTEFGS